MRIIILLLSLIMILPCRAAENGYVKYIALTFDDGPHPKYTPQILKILYENNVPATFFVIGENAERYPELIRAEYDLGCEIGNHTYSHKRCDGACSDIYDEIKKTDRIIFDITGEIPSLFRPPEGKHAEAVDKAVSSSGKKTVLWNIDTRDWAHTDRTAICENIKKNARNGSVILFHDYVSGTSPTPSVLEEMIPYLKKQGYVFVTVSELYNKADTGDVSSIFIG